MASYVAMGVLPVTAILDTLSSHRLSAFSSFPCLQAPLLHHLIIGSIQSLEEITTVKTVKLLFEAQEARYPEETKVHPPSCIFDSNCLVLILFVLR